MVPKVLYVGLAGAAMVALRGMPVGSYWGSLMSLTVALVRGLPSC